MPKEITYYNIRTVRAKSLKEAMTKLEDADFDEENELCDIVLTTQELIEQLLLQLEEENIVSKKK
jgi:DNA polymerase III delta prime subunit